ncbi:MAG: hypothetical protein ACFNWY_06200, partial [Negativicutes bacterium]
GAPGISFLPRILALDLHTAANELLDPSGRRQLAALPALDGMGRNLKQAAEVVWRPSCLHTVHSDPVCHKAAPLSPGHAAPWRTSENCFDFTTFPELWQNIPPPIPVSRRKLKSGWHFLARQRLVISG